MKVRGMQFDGEDAVNRNIDEQTSGHKIRLAEDADDAVNRNIDEQTSGHRMIRRDLEDADEALTEGHRAIRAGG